MILPSAFATPRTKTMQMAAEESKSRIFISIDKLPKKLLNLKYERVVDYLKLQIFNMMNIRLKVSLFFGYQNISDYHRITRNVLTG